MAHSFTAYIDESGDDGLANYRAPGGVGGASTWLTISATVVRTSRELETVTWRDEIATRMPARAQRRALHFKDMNHGQRTMAAQVIGAKPLRSICIIAHKPVTPPGIYVEKNQLYFYLSRYLMERLSWLCRDMRRLVPEGDGRVKIVFSRRGGLSYEGFRAYLERLRDRNDPDIQIHWPVIDVPGIEARDHSTRAGLQIADIVAASVTAGLELDFYGNCERRYAEALKPIIYHRNGNYRSYGMKLYPGPDRLPLTPQQTEFCQLFEG
ncbi:MAG: hypothetical protein JWP35_4644 [Caulobacter sp.]|nr:hypothetical protein [Caulobacter sp.]